MQNINDTLRKLGNNTSFKERYDALRMEVLEHQAVQAFLREHQGEITREIVDKSLMKLHEFITQSKGCSDCGSLNECKNMLQGFEPVLVFNGKYIDVKYNRCKKKIMHDEKLKNERMIGSLYVPRDILKASLADIDLSDKGRFEAIRSAKEFVESYSPDARIKGCYFHGPFGTGKSYLLGAIATELANRQVSSMIVYVPELFREMKNAIGTNTINEKLDVIKNAKVLMLDDIGAETMSSWARDEILGPILQYRMAENLPTFFTSNFDFDGLEHHLTHSQKGDEEKLKAARIMERIKFLANPVKVGGRNRRV